MAKKENKKVNNVSEIQKEIADTRLKILKFGREQVVKNVHERKFLKIKLARLLTSLNSKEQVV